MIRKIKKIYYCLFSLFLLASCQEETLMDKTAGFQISLQDENVSVETKSIPEELGEPTTDKFDLKIQKEGSSEYLYNGKYTSQTIAASAGTYTISASYGTNPVLALDDPYYLGDTSDVVIKDGEKKSVALKCKVANALASVTFPSDTELKKIYSSYWVKVAVENLSCNLEPNSKQSAYFQPGKVVNFYFEGKKINGDSFSEQLKHDNLSSTWKAGDHVMITLKLSDDLLMDIDKVDVKKETISQNIPMDWLPKPKIAAEGFEGNVLSFAETESKTAKLNFNTALPLQDLKLKFNFADSQFSSLNDKEYSVSVPEDKKKVEETLGITLPEIGDEKASLDLSALVSQLQTKAGETVSNTIEVDVKANDRWSSEAISGQENPSRVYTLECKKPIFRVNAYPGNIWTKEFTMNPLMEEQVESGDFATLSKDMKYQFSLNGETDWVDFGEDLRKAELTPGITYFIRGLYRGEVPGEVAEVRTYEAINIPNSNLDDGYTTTYPKKDNPLYTFNGEWIGTRNPLTCHSSGVNAFYVSKSSTLPVNDNGSTVAHMMTMGWGAGNTCSFGNNSGSVINNISSGLLCVGDYLLDGDTILPKQVYTRPTSLSFVFKAAPFKDDEYLISISLLNIGEDGTVVEIGKGELKSGESVSSYTTKEIPVIYNEEMKEFSISHVKVIFKAGTKEDRDHLEDKFRDASVWDGYSNAYIIGSQFWLDSFTLKYDK